jgi:DNA polymerase IV
MINRSIAHMDLDTFFVSCERLADSRLNGLPILIGGTSDRGVVAACSYEARAFGVHSAMPMRVATQLCPQAIVIKGNSMNYLKQSELVTDVIKAKVPVFEKSSIDEFYLDLTGMDKFFGTYKFTTELRQSIIKETGLPISFGLSSNKVVSKVATGEAKPNNQIKIEHGLEKDFLAPLSVRKIPMVGEKTYHTLCRVGLKKVYLVQETPVDFMASLLGQNGISLWKKSNGLDDSPVEPFCERKSISTERTFDKDTIDVAKLRGIMIAMAENLAFQLRRGGKLTACITVKVRYSDFNTTTMQCKIPYSSSDHLIIAKVKELFDSLYNRRLLVRLIGVRFSNLVNGTEQMSLFDQNTKRLDLYSAMDNIRDRFGDRAVMSAAGIEALTIGGINPFNGDSPALLANRRV